MDAPTIITIPEEIPGGFYDGYIIEQAKELREAVNTDWDGIVYVCGRERTGKTTFAQQLAKLLDPTWGIHRMCWDGKGFQELVLAAERLQCIVLDEAYTTFSKARRYERLNDDIISMLTMIGKKNLFIIIVAPLFWQMNEYLMVHRTCAMYRVYSKGSRRGFWELYGYETKEKLYYQGKQYKSFSIVSADRRGRFGSWWVVDKNEYDTRKEAAIQALQAAQQKKAVVTTDLMLKYQKEGAIRFAISAYRNLIIPWGKKKPACALLGISERTFDAKRSMLDLSSQDTTETTETNIITLPREESA